MTRTTRTLAAAAATLVTMLALVVGIPASADAKDITWGRAAASASAPDVVENRKDITWGRAAVKRRAIGTDVTHSANDSGYTAPIHVVCTNGNHRWLYRGDRTFAGSSTTSCGLGGVQWIVTGADQAVRCFNQLPPYGSHYFIGGYREVPSYASLDCYMQRPI